MTSSINKTLPLVSIITVVFNGEDFLEQTILSVLNQTYEDVQYIVIDGGSADKSVDIIKRYADKIDYWISEKDNGIYDAMNKGISLARGDIIGILNSDDYYLENTIDLIVNQYMSGKADILFGNKISLNEDLKIKKVVGVEIPSSAENLNLHSVHPAIFVRKAVYDNLRFNVSYKISSDYDFLLRVFDGGYRIDKVDRTLVVMRLGGASAAFNLEVFWIKMKRFGASHAFFYLIKKLAIYFWGQFIQIRYRNSVKRRKFFLKIGWQEWQ